MQQRSILYERTPGFFLFYHMFKVCVSIVGFEQVNARWVWNVENFHVWKNWVIDIEKETFLRIWIIIRTFFIGISKKVFCIYCIVIVKLFCDTKVQIKATNSQNQICYNMIFYSFYVVWALVPYSDVLDLVSESRF